VPPRDMDEKRRNVMDEKRRNVMDEKRLFYGKKKYQPVYGTSRRQGLAIYITQKVTS
jgi:hypothetical protein